MNYFIGFAIFCVALVLLREKWLRLVGDFLIIEDDLHPADVIHVIAGEDYRTEYAIELYKQGYGKTLFFTGGWCKFHDYYHGAHAQEVALAQGVPLEAIAFDEATVTSTYSEAERLRVWTAQSSTPVRSVIVVSDPFHMRRARWTYKRVLGKDFEIQIAPVPFEQTPYKQQWWQDDLSRIYIYNEYMKLFYYLLRYSHPGDQWNRWLAWFDTD